MAEPAGSTGDGFRTALVVNPRAGGRRADSLRRQMTSLFRERFPDGEVRETRGVGDAEGIVRSLLARGHECIAVSGGDGTLNEAVNGFFRPVPPDEDPEMPVPVRAGACLAVIPLGTGGDFRRSLGIENDPIAAMSLLGGRSVRACDVGHVTYRDGAGRLEGRFFLNITSFGLSALVVDHVNSSSRSLPGSTNFFLATVRAFHSYRNVRLRILMDGSEEIVQDCLVMAVANGRFFGGGMEIAPAASIDDGLLDVMIIGDIQLGEFLWYSRKLYGGRILEHPLVLHRRARRLDVSGPEGESLPMDMDGETPGCLPAGLKLFPGVLSIKT